MISVERSGKTGQAGLRLDGLDDFSGFDAQGRYLVWCLESVEQADLGPMSESPVKDVAKL